MNRKALHRSLDDNDDLTLSDMDTLRMNRDSRDRDFSKCRDDDSNLSNATSTYSSETSHVLNQQSAATTPMNPNMWSGMMGMSYPMVGMNMIMDANVMTNMTNMTMNNYGMIPPMNPMITASSDSLLSAPTADSLLLNAPTKEIVHCKSCTLFPPSPTAPAPTTRERPPGCRTIFVGGLPENMTEEIIMEVFERCGEITTLRLSKKNFCHIRFVYEASVDAAIFLSGYRVRIGSNTDPPNTGRLHVDYAQARDDQYEWECRQRQLQREQRHRERMEEERLRPPSPPPVVHYTDHEASAVSEKIKQDDTFTKAVLVVITWLERGDCSKRNANTFYSMIQSTNSHVRRLLTEKVQYEEELQKAREIMKGRMQGILLQFSQIERLFNAACHKKVWDHFTKAQRKNIEMWKKQSMEIKNVQIELESASQERGDDEMDVSDEEDSLPRKRSKVDVVQDENSQLKEDNNALRMQMEAYKNEVEVVKMDLQKELEDKEKQVKVLQQTLQGMQQQLIEVKKKQAEEETRSRELQSKLKQQMIEGATINLDDTESDKTDSISSDSSSHHTHNCGTSHSSLSLAVNGNATPSSTYTATTTNETTTLSNADARLVGIISAFLNVHPFGAGLDYIWSYVTKLESNLRPSDLEVLMSRFPSVFSQELVGIGANIERRWLFNAFKSSTNSR